MKNLFIALLVLVGVCLAEEYQFTVTEARCKDLHFDSFTHKWTGAKQSCVIECYVKSSPDANHIPSVWVSIQPNGESKYGLDDGIDNITAATFSQLLVSGSLYGCRQYVRMDLDKAKPSQKR
ncbi:hypothetical protein [Fibrobacter sp. UWB12]|uniref:hypothetical protein n=1 Tax=Fibrobacter sp. UWB12 TaxID=1896203 RepID=UPI000922F81D|nr:hypothetical protein [Fibrobacter sp. UWB12]SHK47836.1 hypothetical protein SAMN05720759_10317 [Fibrobacter sp. UWB12]